MDIGLIIPAFIAGIITFLAPCTLPLVPGYLGFISGVTQRELLEPELARYVRRRVFMNGVLYVLGFSLVFILFGTIFGIGGAYAGIPREWLARIGGIFVILFGVLMLGATRLPRLSALTIERHIPLPRRFIHPGEPGSSFLFGAVFAIGWTPCVGPILGAILTLAATSATAGQGALLLGVFSLGLAVPFLAVAFAVGSAARILSAFSRYLPHISFMGGVFIIMLGILMFTDAMTTWNAFIFRFFGFFSYRDLLDYL